MKLTEKFEEVIKKLYGNDNNIFVKQLTRYNKLFKLYSGYFSEMNVYLFSTPGRAEIGGNHTDHNLGKVIAASINLDTIAIVSTNEVSKIILYSEGYGDPFEVDLNNLDKIQNEEGTTNALIRGIASRFIELGYNIGGFSGVITSDVMPGSGLSSSASIEVLIGSIFNSLFNNGQISNKELAIIGQFAENNFFGKPCGLMDQMACAMGGIIAIDFQDPKNPIVEKIDFNFDSQGYKLLIVDTFGNHKDLTEDYASIPAEMKAVANLLGKNVCRDIDTKTLLTNITMLRDKVGDRAVLRVMHFIYEDERVLEQTLLLRANDFNQFLKHVTESGNSSFKWLQNIYSTKNISEQSVTLALALSEQYIKENSSGACRIHGGGFAGTIQVYLPNHLVEGYKKLINPVFGESSVKVLSIRNEGAICLNEV